MSLPDTESLEMTFDPNVIDDLGAKLYSTLPPIISELVANGYDACSEKVEIELHDSGTSEDKKIVVRDFGHGMSFAHVKDEYLVVGRKKRDAGSSAHDDTCVRLPIGKKGLGKLSFFGVAKVGTIETVRDGQKVTFTMDLDKIHASTDGNYKPEYEVTQTREANGTTVTLTDIYRKTDFDKEGLAKSLSNYFIFDESFEVHIKRNGDPFEKIDNELRYSQEKGEAKYVWEFPETSLREDVKQFSFSRDVKGKIILFDKPVRSGMRGVTLFSRKKLVNLPELFPIQGSSWFYQYLTGWLEIDFIDEFVPDVISTNRTSLAWNDKNLAELKEFLELIISLISSEWRKFKADDAVKKVKEKFHVDPVEWKKSNEGNPLIVESIDKLSKKLSDPESIEEDELMDIVEIVYGLAPEHADFVLWRNLNHTLKNNAAVKEKFFDQKYLEAAREAVQLYEAEVQRVTGRQDYGQALMGEVFGADAAKLISITDKSTESERNIDEGQKFLSMGVMTGFKNPALSHTSLTEGLANGNFTDRDCLDVLSTISYLYNRLENRKQPS